MSGGISATTVLAATAAAASAASAISAGQQARRQGNQQAAAAEYNAQLSTNQATQAFAAGVEREGSARRNANQTLAEQRAAIGASGVDLASGSALDLQLQSTRNAELDALQTRYEGVLTGQNYQQQAALGQYSADVSRSNGRAAQSGSYLGAAASLLGGASGALKRPAPVLKG